MATPLCSLLSARSPPIPVRAACRVSHSRKEVIKKSCETKMPSLPQCAQSRRGGIMPFRDRWTTSQQSQKQQSYYVSTGREIGSL